MTKKRKKDSNNILLIIIFILIALLGLLNLDYPLYYFGYLFFIVGYFICTSESRETLIFLFSHGLSGLLIMIIPLIIKITEDPLFSDNPLNIYIYIIIALSLLVIATIIMIKYNLSENFEKKSIYRLIPALLYLLGILMITLLPHIYTIIYNITI